ncbi:hypothetical protein CAEBREN_24923 [Caenorhabditis brenneri]|uniref:Uncharacterized protein n=1 Tax=Caenorhabditis brenneri TaxID=135651 RepID=G0MTH2_CAEBE|nr:hypothetical protein CAEBREN_24923 [Caenorhabditis brenneri]
MDPMDQMEQNEAEFKNFEKLLHAAASGETKKDRLKILNEPLGIARFWFDEAIQRGMTIETFRKDNKEKYEEIKRQEAESLENAALMNRLSNALNAQLEINAKLTEENDSYRKDSSYEKSLDEDINLEKLNFDLANKCDWYEKELSKCRKDLEEWKSCLNTVFARETMLMEKLKEIFEDETDADEVSVTNGDLEMVEVEEEKRTEDEMDVEEMTNDKGHTLLKIPIEELGNEDPRPSMNNNSMVPEEEINSSTTDTTSVADETTDHILKGYINEFEGFLENLGRRSSTEIERQAKVSGSATYVPRKKKRGKRKEMLERMKKVRAAKGKKEKNMIDPSDLQSF